jgi:hypothetical protein
MHPRPTTEAPARRSPRPFRLHAVLLALGVLSGCVPIPYKPVATVNHTPIEASAAAAIVIQSSAADSMPESVAKSIRRVEPRVVLTDARQYLSAVLPSGQGTLSDLLSASRSAAATPLAVDYLLCVGKPAYRQLHDTGAAEPFPYFPVIWVGYEKIQSRSTLSASFVDLHDPQATDELLIASDYSEVVAALVYGVATVARPRAALEQALATDVAHRLAAAHPTGPIRLAVVMQSGGAAEAAGQSSRKPPAP